MSDDRLTPEHLAKRVEDFRPIIERHAKFPGCDCAVCVAAALLAWGRQERERGREEAAEVRNLPASDAERWERGQSHFCLACGRLPPHSGSSAICAACAPPNGSCDCAGCALVQPYRDRLEVLAEEARGMIATDPTQAPVHLLTLAEFAEQAVAAPLPRPGCVCPFDSAAGMFVPLRSCPVHGRQVTP